MIEQNEQFPLNELCEGLRAGQRVVDVSGLEIDAFAFVVQQAQSKLSRRCLVVVPDASDARRVAANLRCLVDAPNASKSQVILLPQLEASPYGQLSPDRQAVMDLMAGLARLCWDDGAVFTVLSAEMLARKTVPREALIEQSVLVAAGQPLERDKCLRSLADSGYRAVSAVEDPGTFAVRGGIVDVFPPHLRRPVRIELWGDEVDNLSYFEPETQRRLESAGDELVLPPVREEFLGKAFRERARQALLKRAGEAQVPTRKLQPMLEDLQNSIPFMGIEGFRPGFFDSLGSIVDYLSSDCFVALFDPMAIGDQMRNRLNSLQNSYESLKGEVAFAPEAHLWAPSEVMASLENRALMRAHRVQMVEELGAVDGPSDALRFALPGNGDLSQALQAARADREPLKPLAEKLRQWLELGMRPVLTLSQQTGEERVARLLKNYGIEMEFGSAPACVYLQPPRMGEARVILLKGGGYGGFHLTSHGMAWVTEEDLFGHKAPRRKKAKTEDAHTPFLQNFRDLEPGDYVVHLDHGIGQYVGLKKLVLGKGEMDFLEIAFAGQDKLYLPVYKLGYLQKFVGPGNTPPHIDKLGGSAWQKTRQKAQACAEEDALTFLDLYARRELAQGYAFSPPDSYFRAFEALFPFEETPDQERAIEEVLADMGRERPMDRLLCGDVGFGKTEVALRAAMKAVLDAKQVAVLVPTTVLALQHYKNFLARFSQYPVRIELLSRLIPKEKQKKILADCAAGKVDILIGTHRLLSNDVQFADLGLLILDEEHRFGVRHKERLKELRTHIDVLTMTATPIPRTLQMALNGLRDLSVITTPPNDRLSVRTFVCRATDELVRDAVMRELSRGGQVFFVHNRVQSIEARKAWLQALVPEARIVVGHGQMEAEALEKVMIDFTSGKYNVLLSTTIIESGIDIPTANTMLIDHADQFGLAQLYQLRGRVGRSRERGYCYLLVPSEMVLTDDARKRLAVINQFTELGSGFHVASHDLELRGAGEMLGTRQKGQVQAVGLDLYSQLIEEAVNRLRGEAPKVEFDPELNLQVAAHLPEDYVPDTHLRLVFYKRLANCEDEEAVIACADEMVDRFGPMPGVVRNLVELMRIRTLAKKLGLRSVDAGGPLVGFGFHPQSPMPIEAIIALVSDPASGFDAPADYRLQYHFTDHERRDTLVSTRVCLQRLAEYLPSPE